MQYIILAILMFGILIAVHEFGHFFTAKLLGVKVNEFAIGMGPKLLSRQGKETLYTWRLLPIGGYCAMEGEDEDTDDPRSFQKAAFWRKLLILIAGSAMNFLTGLLFFLILFCAPGESVYVAPVIDGFLPGFEDLSETGLQPGDRIVEVDGHTIFLYSDVTFFFDRGDDTLDLVVERDGEKLTLNEVYIPYRSYESDGVTTLKRGLSFTTRPAGIADRLSLTFLNAIDTVRMVWISLGDLISGAVGIRDMSGPIGIVEMIGTVGQSAPNVSAALYNILYFAGFIAINLAVMNLLPIPALDGGRVFFLLVNSVIYLIRGKPLDSKYEGYVHGIGLVLLLGLMAVVAASDILKIFGR